MVLFDGVCNLCNTTVQKLIKIDQDHILKFASLQSDFGQKILKEFNFDQQEFDSIIYLSNGKIFMRSDAVLKIASDLGGLWSVLRIFKIIPAKFRNSVYDWVANNRYRWFGKKESCWVPTPELQARFLK